MKNIINFIQSNYLIILIILVILIVTIIVVKKLKKKKPMEITIQEEKQQTGIRTIEDLENLETKLENDNYHEEFVNNDTFEKPTEEIKDIPITDMLDVDNHTIDTRLETGIDELNNQLIENAKFVQKDNNIYSEYVNQDALPTDSEIAFKDNFEAKEKKNDKVIKCPRCGTDLSESNEAICPGCGTKLK